MNIKVFVRKRQLKNALKSLFYKTNRFIRNFLALAFAKRKILFVTNEKIRTITLSPLSQICILIAFSWMINLFYQSLQYNKIISAKSEEIARLKNVATYFDSEFTSFDNKLKKLNDYLISVTGEKILVNDQEKDFAFPNNLGEKNLKDQDFETIEKIKDVSFKMQDIKQITDARIKKIEKTISHTGLNIGIPSKSISSLKQKLPRFSKFPNRFQNTKGNALGGPFVPLENYSASELAIRDFSYDKLIDTAKFTSDIDRLITLEKLVRFMPLSRPIKNYFISSGFGARVDPITKGMAMHQGLDFVGPKHEKIYSPSNGRVILAGKFSDYGNAVVIDHGYGITTRYGHLSKVLVKKGQTVKKGDLLAMQGTTGRSTGEHLHYEVRFKNNAMNPRKFLEAGDKFYDKSSDHTNI